MHGSDLGTTKVLPDWIFDFSKVVKFCQKVPNFNLFLDQKKPYLVPLFYFKEEKIISFNQRIRDKTKWTNKPASGKTSEQSEQTNQQVKQQTNKKGKKINFSK